MYVTFTMGEGFPPQYTADKTFDEITNAFNNNQMIVGVRDDGNSYDICNYKGLVHNQDDTRFHVFERISMHKSSDNTTSVSTNILKLNNDNTTTFEMYAISKADE